MGTEEWEAVRCRIPADFKFLTWSTQKSRKIGTFYVEDAISQGPSDGGEGRLL